MAADSTLVKASFQESISRAKVDVPNLKPLYDSTVDTMQAGQKIITGLIDQVQKQNETDRINKEKQLYGFNKIVDDTNFSLYQMDEPLPNKVVNAMRDGIKELKEEFELYNTYGKNDTEENNNARVRIMGELKRMTSQAVNTRAKFMEISDSYPDWNNARIKTGDITALKSFLDVKNMDANENVSVRYSGSNLVFTNSLTGQNFTAKQMREAMPIIDKKIQAYSTQSANTAITSAATAANNGNASVYSKDNINLYNSTRNQVVGDFLANVKLPEDYVNAATIPLLENTQTLETALESYAPISLEVVKNMFYTEDGKVMPIGETFAMFDKDNDKDVDGDDFNMMKPEELEMFKANHKEMVNAIIRPDHPAFNLKTSKSILGNYYADLEEQAYTNQYNATAENVRRKNKSANENVFKFNVNQGYTMQMSDGTDKYVSGQLIRNMQDFIDNPQEGNSTKAYDGNVYSYKEGKFYMNDNLITQGRISKNLGMWSYGYTPKDTYDTLPDPDLTKVPYPGEDIVFKNIYTDTQTSSYIDDLKNVYKDYPDFEFERNMDGRLIITAPGGTQKFIETGKTNLLGINTGREKEARNEVQAFIQEQVNKAK